MPAPTSLGRKRGGEICTQDVKTEPQNLTDRHEGPSQNSPRYSALCRYLGVTATAMLALLQGVPGGRRSPVKAPGTGPGCRP